jgi:hypothetical protein
VVNRTSSFFFKMFPGGIDFQSPLRLQAQLLRNYTCAN